jgi:fructose-1,6-bisphosphatase
MVKNAGLFLLVLLFLYSGYQTERVLLNRYFITSETPLNRDFKYAPSALPKEDEAIELNFLKRQTTRPAKLKGISILFTKLDTTIVGRSELQLITQGNELKKIPFNTSSIVPNTYTYFPLNDKAYISGKVISPKDGDIQVMESVMDNQPVYSCIIYELDDGSRRYTAGCP